MGEINDQIKALQAEVDRLKAQAPTVNDPVADARWRNQMHEMAERRAGRMYTPSAEEMAAFERACPTSVMRNIVHDNRAPSGRPGVIPGAQQAANVRGIGGGTGWREASPLANPPGTAIADKLMDEQDRRDRVALVAEDAQRRALLKAAKPK
jgi:hypothetical protein